MFTTYDDILPAFFETLPFQEKQIALALAAGATITEIARWLGQQRKIIRKSVQRIEVLYHRHMADHYATMATYHSTRSMPT
jgi:pyrroline-5-carboxylate reductase